MNTSDVEILDHAIERLRDMLGQLAALRSDLEALRAIERRSRLRVIHTK